jgi:hypothetical protein
VALIFLVLVLMLAIASRDDAEKDCARQELSDVAAVYDRRPLL